MAGGDVLMCPRCLRSTGPNCDSCTATAAALQIIRDNVTDAVIREMGLTADLDRLLEQPKEEQ